jgi:hypothetical protein
MLDEVVWGRAGIVSEQSNEIISRPAIVAARQA